MANRFWGRHGASAALASLLCLPLSLAAATPADTPVPTKLPPPGAKPTTVPTESPAPTAVPTPVAGLGAYSSSSKDKVSSADVSKTAETKKPTPVATPTSTAGHRSQALATILAVIPGVAVHGSGHMYAGSWMKGLGLLALEGASAYALYTNGKDLQNDINALQNSNGSGGGGGGGGGIPIDISGPETHVGVCLVATSVFLFSWWEDMAGASTAAGEYNKIVDQDAVTLGMQPVPGGALMALNAHF